MLAFLLHAKEIFCMDGRVLVGIQGSEDLPHVPPAAESIPALGRTISLLGSILKSCQRSLS